MNTRKDFECAATLVRETKDAQAASAKLEGFLDFFLESNPRFDMDRFLKACGSAGAAFIAEEKAMAAAHARKTG